MDLEQVLKDILSALRVIDASSQPFKDFQPGVGPYGEPQLLKLVATNLNNHPIYKNKVVIKRIPDLLIPGQWAMEFKITRPFGDNGKEAENWSVNLLHPYPGNVSSIGDCHKLLQLDINERLAVVVIGYEHNPAIIDLTPLVESFEIIAHNVAHIALSPRIELRYESLIHPIHQVVRLFGWEVLR